MIATHDDMQRVAKECRHLHAQLVEMNDKMDAIESAISAVNDCVDSGSIISFIIECIKAGKHIDMDSYVWLFRKLAESHFYKEKFDGYDVFAQQVHAVRMYGEGYKLEGFDLGACWGAMMVLKSLKVVEQLEDE